MNIGGPGFFAAAALLLAAACAAPSPNGGAASLSAPAAANCESFAEALRACAPAACRQPHPIVPNFTIEHRVTGVEDGACAYTQSVPGDMHMSCRFSERGRMEVAEQMQDMLSGRQTNFSFSFSTSDPAQDTALTRECALLDSNGDVVSWGASKD